MVKERSRKLSALVDGFQGVYGHLIGQTVRVVIVETAADGHHLVGHTKSYAQVGRVPCLQCTDCPPIVEQQHSH